MQRQRELQELVLAEPVRFFVRTLEPMLDAARREIAPFLGCPADDFAFVANATTGVNTVIRSLRFHPGDEIVTSLHEYNACNNVLRWAEQQWGIKPVWANVPYPIKSKDQVVDAFLAAVTPNTKLVLVSHITSPTGMIQPVDAIVAEMSKRGIDTLVDGAHAPGMVPLNVAGIGGAPGPAYYTGNFHKWCCAPHGAAFLYVRPDRQNLMRPTVISHGANSTRADRSRFRLEFDFSGTGDYTAWLCVPDAIRFNASLLPGGWDELRKRNRQLALDARKLVCDAFGTAPPVPDDMIGTLAAAPLPDRLDHNDAPVNDYGDPLQRALVEKHHIQIPIINFPATKAPAPQPRQVRVSANIYNSIEQYQYLVEALKAELK
jgi:isopenicillin-N epimerase